mmetsp:Transcript_36983/g.54306  ORF Transcript_36983/g.54306 Transcript_36983/m.54306 type:complete len:294 (-) Transcript_36983:491-1372(-)|eukprot:CAMPEP_0195524626 /NCGR_PEP_ID=MMETSP0794_2-20130614/24545_1 /TAXON_ID=515487 /ORGANISM="Stephanopyxis turris, Strain CCMP 815" /LENGTH=293 /DNA_ID=CAMNT_0040654881 /DNA_START=279 /DNA_END=1160 /DNA_ORIENTATION=-
MPPKSKKKKDNESKKSLQKKKEKLLEDKTFGLKNKNKSKKVQAEVRSVKNSIMNTGDRQQRKLEEQKKQMKLANKARKKAEQQERDAMFGEALLAVSKKTSVKMKGNVEAKGRDHGDDEKKSGTSRAMKMMFQMDAKEMEDKLKEDPNYVPTIEDDIESQRQKMFEKLKKEGKKGTPVTEETLKAWIERKRKKRAAAAKKLVEAEMRKKKGGKGLSVLSGRELYDYNKALFVDDETNKDDTTAAKAQDDEGNENGLAKDTDATVDAVAEKVQTDLFLEGDDEDLDDLDDIEDD